MYKKPLLWLFTAAVATALSTLIANISIGGWWDSTSMTLGWPFGYFDFAASRTPAHGPATIFHIIPYTLLLRSFHITSFLFTYIFWLAVTSIIVWSGDRLQPGVGEGWNHRRLFVIDVLFIVGIILVQVVLSSSGRYLLRKQSLAQDTQYGAENILASPERARFITINAGNTYQEVERIVPLITNMKALEKLDLYHPQMDRYASKIIDDLAGLPKVFYVALSGVTTIPENISKLQGISDVKLIIYPSADIRQVNLTRARGMSNITIQLDRGITSETVQTITLSDLEDLLGAKKVILGGICLNETEAQHAIDLFKSIEFYSCGYDLEQLMWQREHKLEGQ